MDSKNESAELSFKAVLIAMIAVAVIGAVGLWILHGDFSRLDQGETVHLQVLFALFYRWLGHFGALITIALILAFGLALLTVMARQARKRELASNTTARPPC
jgi:hypothetical protein